ncbi:uncharacterized protein SPPG_09022 [Spizellomyces punctatus DAOM BR117]|uniref:Uncharacterized protein n=1 Tax=Spizellomyces punctatus (strain DAOM BR117) TaxID=645134 RepID=A0A0L0HLH7_SPIPD|nr:uncharacterized protein SPPG_09022 [Spizellomyces punctatus DAOM BR117]KND01913.1 hypothetical protein SPPG_09022 [Spizellomyces punctatus DAOM BR117]|eukprot:XP_016609952.1 hypothetical protein SPPG_09022 [Spizellomyces punctatus DAOM BR117]
MYKDFVRSAEDCRRFLTERAANFPLANDVASPAESAIEIVDINMPMIAVSMFANVTVPFSINMAPAERPPQTVRVVAAFWNAYGILSMNAFLLLRANGLFKNAATFHQSCGSVLDKLLLLGKCTIVAIPS